MNLEEKVLAIVAENSHNKDVPVTLDSRFNEDLGIDSFSTIMILNSIEDEYDFNLDTALLKGVTTGRDVIAMLKEHFPELGDQ